MASGDEFLEEIRGTKHGHSQGDFCSFLEYHGFAFVRSAKHGDIYRHQELAAHADLEVRRKAQVMIPKGRSLKPYVAVDVIERIDLLQRVREEAQDE